MSQADALLNSLATAAFIQEEHITIGTDRIITVPKALQRIAVQYDHDVETVTFDCPRYWDDLDLSSMIVYINYMLPTGDKGCYIANNVKVDEFNENIMHFNWTISRNLTMYKGKISFLICISKTDSDGVEIYHWNSELNEELYVSEGMECEEVEALQDSDLVTQLLLRMKTVEDLVNEEHFIPEASLTEVEEGIKITITDLDHTEEAIVKHGASGVYVGSGEMPEGYNVQIDTSSDNTSMQDIVDMVLANFTDVSEVGQ